MAFFDDISKKLSQAGQKSKDHSEVSRLSNQIANEERNVNNAYCQIGKLYLSMHPNDYEDDFTNMITYITEAEGRISEYQEQIKQIRGIVKCPVCNGDVMSGAAFCNFCGNPMPKSTVNEFSVKCSNCGEFVDKNMRFCTSCGKPMVFASGNPVVQPQNVENQQPAEPTADAPVQEIAENPQPVQNKKCSSCGIDLDNDAVFCPICGTKQ